MPLILKGPFIFSLTGELTGQGTVGHSVRELRKGLQDSGYERRRGMFEGEGLCYGLEGGAML